MQCRRRFARRNNGVPVRHPFPPIESNACACSSEQIKRNCGTEKGLGFPVGANRAAVRHSGVVLAKSEAVLM
ncbi:uncharacterized [Tachysurus ichikawai]